MILIIFGIKGVHTYECEVELNRLNLVKDLLPVSLFSPVPSFSLSFFSVKPLELHKLCCKGQRLTDVYS